MTKQTTTVSFTLVCKLLVGASRNQRWYYKNTCDVLKACEVYSDWAGGDTYYYLSTYAAEF